jgi:hypothetical protein
MEIVLRLVYRKETTGVTSLYNFRFSFVLCLLAPYFVVEQGQLLTRFLPGAQLQSRACICRRASRDQCNPHNRVSPEKEHYLRCSYFPVHVLHDRPVHADRTLVLINPCSNSVHFNHFCREDAMHC